MRRYIHTCSNATIIIIFQALLLNAQFSEAGILAGPASAIVNPGDTADFWTLSNAASLQVNRGGQTLQIFGSNSTVTITGGTTASTTATALEVAGGTASVTDSTLNSTNGIGFTVRSQAVATLTDSVVNASTRGLNLNFGGQLTVVNSQVNATGSSSSTINNGVGIVMVSGAATLSQGSKVVGATAGAVMTADLASTGTAGLLSTLTLDNSILQGIGGSGILVLQTRANRIPISLITLRNGAQVIGGNGIALQTAANSSATLNADDSTLTGGITVATGSTLNATLTDASTMTGALNAAASSTTTLLLDNSSMTGDINATGASVNTTAQNKSNITGAINATADATTSLLLDNSTLTGNITTIGSTVTTTLQNASSLVGSLTATDASKATLLLDNSSMTGDITATGAIVNTTLRNGSQLTGSLSATDSATTSLLLDNSSMTGNVTANNATADVTLQNAATLTGQLTDVDDLSLSDNSTWNLTQSSTVNSLVINDSRVNLNGTIGAFNTLTLGSLSGSGTFALNTDIAQLQGDKLVITGEATGNHTLDVANSGAEPTAGDSGLVLVTSPTGSAQFTVLGGQVDAGTYTYDLAHEGANWVLVQRTTGGEDVGGEEGSSGEGGSGSEEDGGTPIVSPSARTVLGLFNAAPTVWYGETATLRSRMGELRVGTGSSGPWVRAYSNKYDLSAGGGVAYQQQQNGVSFGIDAPLPAADGRWLVGVMGGYSHSSLALDAGPDSSVDSYYMGLYSTWLSESGYYVDALIKANRFENHANVVMSDGVQASGGYTSYGVGSSVEVGKHIHLPNNWFIEPYTQFSALWVPGDNLDLNNGMDADSNHANSLLGTVGTHVGRTFNLKGGGVVQPYIKVAAAEEFAKTNRVTINSTNTFNNNLSGGRIELGTGIIAQVSSALQVHADFDYSDGQNIREPWGVSIGVRYAW